MPADWAAQRVKSLSLGNAIVNAVLPRRNQKEITSLIEEFQYPKFGPGMMWEVCRDKVVAAGSDVVMGAVVTAIRHAGRSSVTRSWPSMPIRTTEYPCTDVISSMPISELIAAMNPPAPDDAAGRRR